MTDLARLQDRAGCIYEQDGATTITLLEFIEEEVQSMKRHILPLPWGTTDDQACEHIAEAQVNLLRLASFLGVALSALTEAAIAAYCGPTTAEVIPLRAAPVLPSPLVDPLAGAALAIVNHLNLVTAVKVALQEGQIAPDVASWEGEPLALALAAAIWGWAREQLDSGVPAGQACD